MIRCAFFEMKRLPSSVTPRCTSDSISAMSEPGSTTTPQPMTQRQPGWRMPDGIVCKTYFSRPTTTVWPALLPPANRATTFTCGVRRSTIFPLPSSPHCVPTTTMLGIAHAPEEACRLREDLRHRQNALGAGREVEREELLGLRARAPDDQHVARALRACVGDRLLEPAADHVAREARGALEHGFVAEERGQREQRLADVRRRAQLRHLPLQRGGILARERRPELAHARRLGARLLAEPTEEVGVPEVDLEALEPERAQPLDRHRDDLDLGLRLLEPDQLDARLVELAVVRYLRLVVAEHVGHVPEADGLGLVPEPRRHDPGDLRRDVGAEREHPAGLAVHELEHVLLDALVGTHREHIRVLERGGDDIAVAPPREDVEQPRLHVALACRLIRQVDARALRELRV